MAVLIWIVLMSASRENTLTRQERFGERSDPSTGCSLRFAQRTVLAQDDNVPGVSSSAVPANWGFVQVDGDLFGFEIFLDTPRSQFAAQAGAFACDPARVERSRLHVVSP